ncbi:chemotaxis protein CheB [Nitrospira sp. Nam74]
MINADRIPRDIIVIGASAGGVEALIGIFAGLPAALPAVVAAVIHRSPIYNLHLGPVLGRRATMTVREPEDGEAITAGTIYLAPRDHHMVFTDKHIELNRGPKEHFTRPAIDPLFISAARHYGERVVGLLLSGGGDDGVAGLISIKHGQGVSIVQDPHEAKMPAMPMNALRYDHVDLVVPLSKIPAMLVNLVQGHPVS